LCLAYGLALADHWPLMILSTMALVATAWHVIPDVIGRLKSPRFVVLSLVAFVAGLSPYVILLLNPHPAIAVFGGIHSFRGFLGYVERSAYHDDNPIAGVSDKLHYAAWLIRLTLTEFGWAGAPLVLLGSIVSFRLLSRSMALALVLLWLGSTYVLLMLLNFEYSPFFRAVFMPYPIIACAAVALWFAFGVSTISAWARRYSAPIGRLIGTAAIALILLSNYARMDRSRSVLVDHYMRTVLMSLPEHAVLFVRGDNETGPVGYLHYVAGIRPDVEVRDWSNLVFANRLASPLESRKAQQRALRDFIDASDRPVFVMDDAIEPRIDYGAYYKFDPSGRGGYHFVPDFGPLVDMLVEVYEGGYVTNAHEQYFLLNRLAQFAKLYVGYAVAHEDQVLPPDIASRVLELQRTFPGQLVTLREVVDQGKAEKQKQALLELAALAVRQIPQYASRHSLGVFYGLYGKIELLAPANRDAARRYLKASLKVDPTAGNTSVCDLYRIYEEEGDEDEARAIESRYARAECESQ
ncbi:MAG TPA: hypothetical protein VJ998_04040, partial [Pseudomonadales bacterium]|nr:hypothetical protein [Pseudomonadales bacterium]